MPERTRMEREFLELREAREPPEAPSPTHASGRQTQPSNAPTASWTLMVVDEKNQPIDGEPFQALQAGSGAHGVLKGGIAVMDRIDPNQPFHFELRGRVCAIKHGAVLVTSTPGVEHGGTVVDWSEADLPGADRSFWPDYEKYRTAPALGPSRFWQHEHITRRPIKLRADFAKPGSKPATLIAVPLKLRVGPLVRYTSASEVVIWLETQTPAMVRIRFGKQADKRAALADAYGSTVRVGGRYFALVALSGLSEGVRYEYTLELASLPAPGGVPVDQKSLQGAFPKLENALLAAIKGQLAPASFDSNEWLTFRTLRNRYDNLRFAHGSCRRFPFDRAGSSQSGNDAFDAFSVFLRIRDRNQAWPSFLLLTGDQIYADDIGHQQGIAIGRQRWARRIPGQKVGEGEGAWAGRFSARFTGVAKAPKKKGYRIDNHALWKIPVDRKNTHTGLLYPDPPKNPDHVPAGDTKTPAHAEIPPLGKPMPMHAADFAEYSYLYEAAWAGGELVRKVLANLPTFMTFDDHEITDDWNANKNWLDIVHRPLAGALDYWPETIADGLIAYWLYQGWGNLSPADWQQDPRVKLLESHRAAGSDALASLRQLVRRDIEPPAKTLTWDYALPIESPLFYVSDCRMRRQLPPSKGVSFDDRVLDPAGLSKMHALFQRSSASVAFLISSLPLLMPGLIGDAFRLERVTASFLGIPWLSKKPPLIVDEKFRREHDMEHWVANRSWFDLMQFLSDLSRDAPLLKAVVALSGDVHFSYNMLGRLDPKQAIPKAMKLNPPRTDADGRAFPYLIQLTSSGIKQKQTPVTEYRARLLVEDDALVKNPGFKDETTKKLEELRSGVPPVANGLYDDKFTREHYDFFGMKLRLGGFDGIDNPRRTLLMENSVAVVDVTLKKSGAEFNLVEHYVTDSAPPKIRYAFQLGPKGFAQTVPRFR